MGSIGRGTLGYVGSERMDGDNQQDGKGGLRLFKQGIPKWSQGVSYGRSRLESEKKRGRQAVGCISLELPHVFYTTDGNCEQTRLCADCVEW